VQQPVVEAAKASAEAKNNSSKASEGQQTPTRSVSSEIMRLALKLNAADSTKSEKFLKKIYNVDPVPWASVFQPEDADECAETILALARSASRDLLLSLFAPIVPYLVDAIVARQSAPLTSLLYYLSNEIVMIADLFLDNSGDNLNKLMAVMTAHTAATVPLVNLLMCFEILTRDKTIAGIVAANAVTQVIVASLNVEECRETCITILLNLSNRRENWKQLSQTEGLTRAASQLLGSRHVQLRRMASSVVISTVMGNLDIVRPPTRPPSRAQVIDQLKSDSINIRREISKVLCKVASLDENHLPLASDGRFVASVCDLMASLDLELQKQAVKIISELAKEPIPAVKLAVGTGIIAGLSTVLTSADFDVQRASIEALGRLSKHDEVRDSIASNAAVVEALVRLLQADSPVPDAKSGRRRSSLMIMSRHVDAGVDEDLVDEANKFFRKMGTRLLPTLCAMLTSGAVAPQKVASKNLVHMIKKDAGREALVAAFKDVEPGVVSALQSEDPDVLYRTVKLVKSILEVPAMEAMVTADFRALLNDVKSRVTEEDILSKADKALAAMK
jgi:hypothetical protein